LLAALSAGCGESEAAKTEAAPILGVLELPLANRHGGSAPAGAARVEVSPGEIRVEGETVVKLENGKVPPAEAAGYVLPKLKDKLGGKSALALSVHAAVPYATLARVMQSGFEAGAKELAFQVRKPGTQKDTGWLTIRQNHFTDTPENGKFAESELLPWDSFAKRWDESLSACQAASRSDCGYAPLAKAEGGKLDMMLRVRGSGLALRMRQAGVPDAGLKPADKPKKPKVEMLDGIKGAPQAEEAPPEPSTEHVFTLRSDAATATPSPISGITNPVCGSQSCPVVLDAEGISMTVHVLSLLGAAFPDGTPEPKVAWVLPPAK
jgi:hypothetical protein